MSYDSRSDTNQHIQKVRDYLNYVASDLITRGNRHDKSKLEEPELSIFNEYTPKLQNSTYGSDEYKTYLKEMGVALNHHYQVNDHHPEHFTLGVQDMNLIQVLEMLCDWKAASERHSDGDIDKSISLNAKRFGYGREFERLLRNTAITLGWIQVGDDE